MSDLIIPDSRFEMPSLFYPNRKPAGNVKIDWSHDLANGLDFLDLNNQTFFSHADSNDSDSEVSHDSSHGQGADYSSATRAKKFDAYSYVGRTEITTFVIFKYFGGGGLYGSITRQDLACIPFRLGYGKAQSVLWADSTSDISSPNDVAINKIVTGAVTWRSGGDHRIFLDGEMVAQAGPVNGSIKPTSRPFVIGLTEWGSEKFLGEVYYVASWNKQLSERQMRELHANPYQFIIPA